MTLAQMATFVVEITAFLCLIIACGQILWLHVKNISSSHTDTRKGRKR